MSQSQNTSPEWYKGAAQYWDHADTSDDGMLGGFGKHSPLDIVHSLTFIRKCLKKSNLQSINRVLDVGAGIGRITKKVLMPIFQNARFSMLEPSQRFLDKSVEYFGAFDSRVEQRFCLGFQDFPALSLALGNLFYDIIFIQWVLLYLTDEDIIESLKACKNHLPPNGAIFVKENCNNHGELYYDESDCSVTRPAEYFDKLFIAAGFEIISKENVKNWPTDLFPIYAWMLIPKKE
ncbi:hypothetical protein RCL1_005926 [Eukaryota sp. TZLM3-RCL]